LGGATTIRHDEKEAQKFPHPASLFRQFILIELSQEILVFKISKTLESGAIDDLVPQEK
jgi:hypothetical protein